MKNGKKLIVIIERKKFINGIWDPYHYRIDDTKDTLSEYVTVQKISNGKNMQDSCFEPIEYKNIPKGQFLSFLLNKKTVSHYEKLPTIGEQVLLVGTMRAYLGNVIVTPKSEWLGLNSPAYFSINSEFVEVTPKDGLYYFWWAFLKSPSFLHSLPTGSGGTRPRLNTESILKIPVNIPPIDIRKEIHEELFYLAQQEWNNNFRKELIISKLWEYNDEQHFKERIN
jgi:hypothetical protein